MRRPAERRHLSYAARRGPGRSISASNRHCAARQRADWAAQHRPPQDVVVSPVLVNSTFTVAPRMAGLRSLPSKVASLGCVIVLAEPITHGARTGLECGSFSGDGVNTQNALCFGTQWNNLRADGKEFHLSHLCPFVMPITLDDGTGTARRRTNKTRSNRRLGVSRTRRTRSSRRKKRTRWWASSQPQRDRTQDTSVGSLKSAQGSSRS
jgi:hypothetical protein